MKSMQNQRSKSQSQFVQQPPAQPAGQKLVSECSTQTPPDFGNKRARILSQIQILDKEI